MKIGTKLVCIFKGKYWYGVSDIDGSVITSVGPVYNEIVTYNGTNPNDSSQIYLVEYPIAGGEIASWDKSLFVPLRHQNADIDVSISIEIVEEVPDLVPVLV